MKKQKGITMTSLAMYIVSFTIIIGIISTITNFFSKNVNENLPQAATAEYNKFNLYMLNESKEMGNTIKENTAENILEFSNGDKFTLDVENNILYFNKIKLCENISGLTTETYLADNGKTVLKTTIQIKENENTKDFVTEYILE